MIIVFKFFVRGLPLVLRVGRKIKTAGDICKRALDIEFEQDWSYWFIDTTLGDGKKIKKYIFLVSGIFPGKADSVQLFGFECRPTIV